LFAFYLDDIVNDIDFVQGNVEKADNYNFNQDNVVNLVIENTVSAHDHLIDENTDNITWAIENSNPTAIGKYYAQNY